MPRIKLTKRNIDSLKPATTRYTAWDSDLRGFGVRITPSGEKTYVMKYLVVYDRAARVTLVA
jgi:hypothetical protein